MMTTPEIAVDEYYHLYNRGVSKQNIFLDERDYTRFLLLIIYYQSPVILTNFSHSVTSYIRSQTPNIRQKTVDAIIKQRAVGLNAFCLMPNHFHLLIREVEEGGIAKYMQRVSTAYANYFNTKYNRKGHLFENSYRAVHIEDNDQLLYVSAYIHKNPLDVNKNYVDYPRSSFHDYVGENRWSKLLEREMILGQFKNPREYASWTKNTTAKDFKEELEESLPELLKYKESDT